MNVKVACLDDVPAVASRRPSQPVTKYSEQRTKDSEQQQRRLERRSTWAPLPQAFHSWTRHSCSHCVWRQSRRPSVLSKLLPSSSPTSDSYRLRIFHEGVGLIGDVRFPQCEDHSHRLCSATTECDYRAQQQRDSNARYQLSRARATMRSVRAMNCVQLFDTQTTM